MRNQAYVDVAKIMSRGQVVIPKKIRDAFNLSEQSLVGFIPVHDGILIKPLQPPSETKQERLTSLTIKKPSITSLEFLKTIGTTKEVAWTKTDDKKRDEDRKADIARLNKLRKLEPYWE